MKDYKNVNEKIRTKLQYIKKIEKTNPVRAKKMEDALVMSLSYLVHSVIYKYKKIDSYDDLYQEGMMGLINAVRNYNVNLTFHFTRYALWWIKTRVYRYVKKNRAFGVGDFFVENELSFNENPEQSFLIQEELILLRKIIPTLSIEHQCFLNMRYGLCGNIKHGLREIVETLKIKRNSIYTIEEQVLNKLKYSFNK